MRRYKVLTFLIMVLGRIRQQVAGNVMGLIKDSPLVKDEIGIDELVDYRGILIMCCDCGLEHRFFNDAEILGAWPLRPIGYDYQGRLTE